MNRKLLEKQLAAALASNQDSELTELVQTLVFKCIHQEEHERGQALAASFDLLVGLFYYEKITANGWLECTHGEQHFFFPYVNACPRCALEERFVFHKAGKSDSANIGKAAVRALVLFIREWFRQTGSDLEVCQSQEPVDMVVYDRENDIAFLAEVKSAPLFTLPLVIKPDQPSDTDSDHQSVRLPILRGTQMGLLLPLVNEEQWSASMCYFSEPFDGTTGYFTRMLTQLVNDDDFYGEYLYTWIRAFAAYADKDKAEAVYWLTGGCGKPSPMPSTWPKAGSSHESISDGKTSVGMDRTDDIKKGVYQLLKLRINEDDTTDAVQVRVGIVSNAHAARHHDEYVGPIQDVMWLKTGLEDVETIDDLPAGTPLFNLYDGIITFTKSFTRDGWLQNIFDFNTND